MNKNESIIAALEKIDEISEAEWASSLNERKISELRFHDENRDRQKIETMDRDTYQKYFANKKYYTATDRSKRYVDQWIARNSKDKIFLDYACGNGFNAIRAAQSGASLAIGIDISPLSVRNARADAKENGVENRTFFVQADAENTKLPPNSVDSIICSGMLHHLDLSFAFPELRRILKPGGRILAVEALDYNPLIKAYRYLTPAMRTDWEKAHILSLKDLEFARRFFNVGETKYWHIMSILTPHCKPLGKVFDACDSVLTRIPILRLISWTFTFEMIKKAE